METTDALQADRQIAAMRRFNRFYTQKIGVLSEGLLSSRFSLTEARLIYELAHRPQVTSSELARDLGLDAGYLSRLLRGFEQQGLLERTPSERDGRQQLLALTPAGGAAFAQLNERSRTEIHALLDRLVATERRQLLAAMQTIEELLGAPQPSQPPYTLREPKPGDLGWVVERHGALYAQEYGWDARFEGLVAGIVGRFVEHFDPQRERCWIAERAGQNVGSVLLVKKTKTIAKLRLLLVEPAARGLGLGARLVHECEQFARQAGYRTIMLWTNSNLSSARRIYERSGYRLVQSEPHHSFGHDLVGETWEKKL